MEAKLNSDTEIRDNKFYYERNRDRVRMEHPRFSSVEVRKKCDEDWKALSSVHRKLYQEMSAVDKTRHTKEMEAELNFETEIKEKEPNNRPVAARPASKFYHKLNRERVSMAHPRFTSIEVRKKCEAEWNALASEGRKKYQDMSAQDKTYAPHQGNGSKTKQ